MGRNAAKLIQGTLPARVAHTNRVESISLAPGKLSSTRHGNSKCDSPAGKAFLFACVSPPQSQIQGSGVVITQINPGEKTPT
jgi:hypothetical protein